MNRRHFIAAGGAAGLVAARRSISTAASAAPASTPVLMKLGCQTAPTNDVHLRYLARYGVQNIGGYRSGECLPWAELLPGNHLGAPRKPGGGDI
jgi:hypothetical protein